MKTTRIWLNNTRRFLILTSNVVSLIWRAQPLSFTCMLLLQILQGVAPLATAWVTKALFDLLGQSLQGDAPGDILQTFCLLLAAQVVLAVITQLIQPLYAFLNSDLRRLLTLNVQSHVYQKISQLVGLAPFEDPRFHNTIQLATQGAQFGPSQMLGTLSTLVPSVTTFATFASVLLTFNPLLAGAVAFAILPQFYARIKVGRQRFDLAALNTPRERRAGYYGYLLSAAPFAKEIRLFNLGDYFLQAFQAVTRQIHQTQRGQERREVSWQAVLSLLSGLVSAGTFIAVAMQALAGRLSLGNVTLYLSAVTSVQTALSGIVFALANVNESMLFHTHFSDLLALPQPLLLAQSPRRVPPLTIGIELHDVSFRYDETHPWVIRNTNLSIPAGKCVALVGLNGAGKTTLVKLLTRLYDPTEGIIRWNGIDLREFDPVDLRCRLGVIFQDFGRYDLTVLENIGLGDVRHLNDIERVTQVASHIGIHDLIASLPQGYQTVLSRWLIDDGQGVDLSGGEWQKIAIARMFMRDADFLVLDEPTAALDAQAEYDTYRYFAELMRGRTSLLISHRFSTVRMADAIAVLENGRVTEYGSHTELLSRGGTYAKLYNLQAERYR